MYFSDYPSFNSQTVDFQKVVTFSLKTTLQEMEVKNNEATVQLKRDQANILIDSE